jgi:hypothetical protein
MQLRHASAIGNHCLRIDQTHLQSPPVGPLNDALDGHEGAILIAPHCAEGSLGVELAVERELEYVPRNWQAGPSHWPHRNQAGRRHQGWSTAVGQSNQRCNDDERAKGPAG